MTSPTSPNAERRTLNWLRAFPLPTYRAVLVAALGAVAGAAWGWDGALFVDGALLALCVADFALTRRQDSVQASRLCPERLSQGIPVEVRILLGNPGPMPMRMRVRDQTPQGWEAAPVLHVTVPARGSRSLSYSAVPPNRGLCVFGELLLRLEGPLGMLQRPIRISATRKVAVYPPLEPHRYLHLATYRRVARNWGIRPSRRQQEGREFESLREYVEGDDPRKIHWKATARLDRPIVQQHQAERNQIVMILLDTGRLMAAISQGRTKLDYALEAAVHLSHAALAAGDRVGVLAFADRVISFVPPRRAKDQLQRILDAVMGLEPVLVEPQYERAVLWLKTRLTRRSLVVIFTDLLDEVASEALMGAVALLRPRHLPLCAAIRESEWSELMDTPPAVVQGVYERAVLHSLLRQRSKALGSMVQKGALAVDLPPAALCAGALERYQEVKQRGLL